MHLIIRGEQICLAVVFGSSLLLFRLFLWSYSFLNQKKPEEKQPKGHRLNEKITAQFVRLVTDEGHAVVSRNEALQRAKSLELDLVEVDRHAKPPVCKIMDYNRERYMRKVKQKQRSKIRAKGSLKSGDCKELRVSAKTELKDLEMKADMAKRLMERGHRVKCMALGNEDQDLGGLLSKLSEMLEDVAFMEIGPKVEKKQAYFIVRHVKFGPPKKGAKKASNSDGATSAETQKASNSDDTSSEALKASTPATDIEDEEIWSEDSDMDDDDELDTPSQGQEGAMVSDSKYDFQKAFDLNHDVIGRGSRADTQIKFDARTTPPANNKFTEFSQSRTPNVRTPSVGPSLQQTENRYARNMKNNTSNRQVEPRTNFSPPGGRFGPAGGCGSQLPGFGIFSAPKTDASEKHGSEVEVNQHGRGNPFVRRNSGPGNSGTVKSGSSPGSGVDDSGKYGIFSRK